MFHFGMSPCLFSYAHMFMIASLCSHYLGRISYHVCTYTSFTCLTSWRLPCLPPPWTISNHEHPVATGAKNVISPIDFSNTIFITKTLLLLLPTGFRGSPLILAAGPLWIPYGQAHAGPPAGEDFLQGKSNRQKDYWQKCRCPCRRWWLLTIPIRCPYHFLSIPLPLAYTICNKMWGSHPAIARDYISFPYDVLIISLSFPLPLPDHACHHLRPFLIWVWDSPARGVKHEAQGVNIRFCIVP